VAYPEAPWEEISRHFVESLGLTWNPLPRNFPVRAGFREEGEGHVGRGGHRWRATVNAW
jgi:hypothetical protein